MEDLLINKLECKNTFEPLQVFCIHISKSRSGYDNADLLEMYLMNGALVLTVGTDNSDDYYPSFVTDWQPENIPNS